MNNSLNYFKCFLLIIGTTLIGCSSDRYAVFIENNKAPELSLNIGEIGNDSVWRASAKIKKGLKTNSIPIDITIKGSDAENPNLELDARYDSTKINVTNGQGNNLNFPLNVDPNTDVNFLVSAVDFGISDLHLSLIDELGKETKAVLSIEVFDNDLPVAKITKEAELYGIPAPNVYQINADQSFDSDEEWGGRVVQYVWTLNNSEEFITEEPFFRQAFVKGGYKVTLFVIDNDGGQSELVEETITIN
jgi:hypothetical protein